MVSHSIPEIIRGYARRVNIAHRATDSFPGSPRKKAKAVRRPGNEANRAIQFRKAVITLPTCMLLSNKAIASHLQCMCMYGHLSLFSRIVVLSLYRSLLLHLVAAQHLTDLCGGGGERGRRGTPVTVGIL